VRSLHKLALRQVSLNYVIPNSSYFSNFCNMALEAADYCKNALKAVNILTENQENSQVTG
jgi:hypothetical protein